MGTAKAIAAASLLGLITAGCSFSSADPASAPQTAALPSGDGQQTFPIRNVALTAKTNLFAFWKIENGQVNPADVAAVVSLSEKLDADEDTQFDDSTELNTLNNAFTSAGFQTANLQTEQASLNLPNSAFQDPTALKATLDAALGPAQTSLNTLNTANPQDEAADAQITKDTNDENQAQNLLNEENAKPSPNPTTVAALTQEINNDDAQIQTLHQTAPQGELTWRQYTAQATPLQSTIQGASDFENVVTGGLTDSWYQWLKTTADLQQIVFTCSDDVTEILGGTLSNGTTAPGYVMPVVGSNSPELTVQIEADGTIDMKVDNWIPPVGWESPDGSDTDNGPVFTTEDGSIRDVAYTALGGVYTFTLVTRWAEYGFKIARSHYDAHDGLQHYQGEINLYSDDASQAMRGVAVLDESPN